jgi:hypothetical protein
MTKQQFAEWGMWAFIVTVIIAGFFGPWVMSLLLSGLAILCFSARFPNKRTR